MRIHALRLMLPPAPFGLRRTGRTAALRQNENSCIQTLGSCVNLSRYCKVPAWPFRADLTVQSPHEVWVAIEGKSWRPTFNSPAVRVVRFSGNAWTEGVEHHVIDGVQVKITSVAKTIADCFKFRNKVGLDVALEALRDAWRAKKLNTDDLWRYAEVCRVLRVVRPYLDTLE